MRQSLWRKTSEQVSRLFRPLRGELLETRFLLSSTPDLVSAAHVPAAEVLDAASESLLHATSPNDPAPIPVLAGDSIARDDVADAAVNGDPDASAPSAVGTSSESTLAASEESPPARKDSSEASSRRKSDAVPAQSLSEGTSAEQAPGATVADGTAGEGITQDTPSAAGPDLKRFPQVAARGHRAGDHDHGPAPRGDSGAACFDDTAIDEAADDGAPSTALSSSSAGVERIDVPMPQPAQPMEGDGAAQDHLLANLALGGSITVGPQKSADTSAQPAVRLYQAGMAANTPVDADLLTAVTDWWELERLSSVVAHFVADAGQAVVSAHPAAAANILLFVGPEAAAAAFHSTGAAGRPAEPSSLPASSREAKVRRRFAVQSAHDQVLAGIDDNERWLGFLQLVEQELTEAGLVFLDASASQRDAVEAELAQVKDQLARQKRLAMVGQVAASIAHDLRNPLAVVRTAAYLLKRCLPDDDPKPQSYLDAIEAEVETANRIISNLMEVVRAKEAVKQAVDFGSTVHEVFERLQNRGEIECRIECQPEPFTVHADPVQLRQVLGNLLSNGAEAMGGKGEIRIEARQAGEFDVLTVRDDGPGIPPEIRHTLFEPLVSTRVKGTGLGLAICRQIVERHGGTIELLPTEGGAAFQIRLPQSPALSPPAAD